MPHSSGLLVNLRRTRHLAEAPASFRVPSPTTGRTLPSRGWQSSPSRRARPIERPPTPRSRSAFLSVLPDNYSLSFSRAGYRRTRRRGGAQRIAADGQRRPLQDAQDDRLDSLRAPPGSAFQRGMTIDTYTVTGSQIQTVQGKAFNANENDLLRSIPSVTIDKTGHGIDSRRLRLRGRVRVRGHRLHHALGQPAEHAAEHRQLQPAQRRRQRAAHSRRRRCDPRRHRHRPGALHGQERNVPDISFTATSRRRRFRTCISWGWSGAGRRPTQRLSNYAGFIGIRQAYQYGIPGTAANTLGTLGTNAATLGSTIDPEPGLLLAAVSVVQRLRRQPDLPVRQEQRASSCSSSFKARRSSRRSITAAFSSCRTSRAARRPAGARPYPVIGPNGPVNSPQQQYSCDSLIPLFPGQPNTYAFVSQADSRKSPFLAYKVRVRREPGHVVAADGAVLAHVRRPIARHARARHLRRALRRHAHRRPDRRHDADRREEPAQVRHDLRLGACRIGNRYDFTSYTAFTTPPFIVTYAITHPNQPLPLPYTYTGLLPNNNPSAPGRARTGLLLAGRFARSCAFTAGCGYLSSYFPGGVRFPFEEDVATVAQQQYGLYLQDTLEMSNRWKAEAGVRLDGYNFQIPDAARRAGVNSGGGTSAALRAALRRLVLARRRATRFAWASGTRCRCRCPACWAPT